MKSNLLSALQISTSTTLLCVVVAGVVFLPREIARLRAKPEMSAVSCESAVGGKVFVSLAAEFRGGPVGRARRRSLILHDLSRNAPAIRPLTFPDTTPMIFTVDFPGNRIFLSDESGLVTIANLQSTNIRWQVLGRGLRGSLQGMACTADSNSLVFSDLWGLYAWNLEDRLERGNPRWRLVGSGISCFVLTPDSRRVICCRTIADAAYIVELNIQTGEIEGSRLALGKPLKRLTITINGKYLLGADNDGEVVLLQRESTEQAWQPVTIPGLCTGLTAVACFSPDVRSLITSRSDGRGLIAWDLHRKEQMREFDRLSAIVAGCQFLDSGQFLSWGTHERLRIWDLQCTDPVREISLDP